jgi:hypothetical protein
MTKHTIVNFQLAKSGVAWLAGGASAIGMLLAAAGYVGGLASSSQKAAVPLLPASTVQHAAPAVKSEPAPPAQQFSLRVKTFFTEGGAKAEQTALKEKGIESAVVTLPQPGAGALYSLEIGPYATRAEAIAASIAFGEQKQVQTRRRYGGQLP